MGKVDMKATDYYKSGRMLESSIKGGQVAKVLTLQRLQERIRKYNLNPRKCQNCECDLTYQQRYNKYCSISCGSKITNLLRRKIKPAKVEKTFDQLGFDTKRKIVIKEQQNKCGKCNISEWKGQTLTLQVDHIDGNNMNDNRANLIALCPNCHSLTPTYCGKNKKSRTTKGVKLVEDDVLLLCLKSSSSIRQGLLMAGLAAKGGNYNRAKILLKQSGS